MSRNYITRNRVWASMVMMLAAAFTVVARGEVIITLADEPQHSVEAARRERVAEVMPAINLVSTSTNKKSVTLGGIASIVREEAFGVQIGGLYNHVGGVGCGAAIAGLCNTMMGPYYGLQVGGLCNYNADGSKGVMIGGLGNIVGGVGCGAAIAGLCNTMMGPYYGLQVGGLCNYNADGSKGVMIGGLGNIVGGVMDGMQLAGVTNIAKEVRGLQLAGVVNVAQRVRGVQLASVLNIAEESDFPIGLVNIVKHGSMGVALTYDIMGNTLVSFRSGGRYTYGIVGVGLNQHTTHKLVAEAGYGIHIPVCDWLQVDNEMKATAPINTSSVNFSYLLAPSVTLWKHCNLFGGPSLNYNMSETPAAEGLCPREVLWENADAALRQCMYIGYQVGVQYVF